MMNKRKCDEVIREACLSHIKHTLVYSALPVLHSNQFICD